MSKLSRKSRRAFAFRPEMLESRELLSTGLLPHQEHADLARSASNVAITGSLSGNATFTSASFDVVFFKYASLLQNVSGTLQQNGGAASLAGTISGKGFKDTTTATVFSKGLTLSGANIGAIKLTPTGDLGNVATFNGQYSQGNYTFVSKGTATVKSGTYFGYKGSFSASGSRTPSGTAFTISLTITLHKNAVARR
jgi:hypothetical protein